MGDCYVTCAYTLKITHTSEMSVATITVDKDCIYEALSEVVLYCNTDWQFMILSCDGCCGSSKCIARTRHANT